jgi:hypothetical protein
VYAPVAATDECVQLLQQLGEVQYMCATHTRRCLHAHSCACVLCLPCCRLLPTTVVEHKLFVRNFVKRFPRAKVYVAPGNTSRTSLHLLDT